MGGATIRYSVLGQLEVVDRDGPVDLGGLRQQLVLAVLLDHAGERLSVARLIDAVWGEAPPASARKTLQSYVSRLRAVLPEHAIATVDDGYRVDVDGDALDVRVFERLAGEGLRLLERDPTVAGDVLGEALALWRGAPFGSLGEEPALRPSRQQLLERRLEVLESRIEADIRAGRLEGLVAELTALTADHPLREPLHRLLMHVLYIEDRQGEALDVARRLRARLADRLGLDPSPAVDALVHRILDRDPSLTPGPPPSPGSGGTATGTGTATATLGTAVRPRTTVPRATNPYRGLQVFRERDAPLFFGRGELVGELLGEVARRSFVLVVGPSGSGKSSVVLAGLIPAIRAEHPGWTIATMVPGAHPFAEFEAAMARSAPQLASALAEQLHGDDLDLLRVVLTAAPEDGRVLLVVDQFEELFLLSGPAERDRFVRGLVEATEDPHSRVAVVATIRADFLSRPLQHPALGPVVEAATVMLPPLQPAQLEAACVGPAHAVGVDISPELVTELVADVAQEPGALPLFQFTLTQLFAARDGGPLTLAGYQALGGLRGSLSRRADQLLATLDAEGREAARQVLLRLVTIGEGAEDTRRRARRSDLASTTIPADALDAVLTTFGDARLLSFDRDAVTGDGTVEVAHESLLREWPVLRAWIDEAREELTLRSRLTAAASEWLAAGRDPDFLLAGSRLASIASLEDPTQGLPLELTALEREFVDASRRHQDEVDDAERARVEHEAVLERRARRRLRLLVVVLAVAAVVSTALGVVATDRADELARQRDLQLVRQLGDVAAELGARDPELGLLAALHAARLDDGLDGTITPDTVASLHWAIQAARIPYPDGLPVRTVRGPRGSPRGIFEMGVPELVGLARANLSRELTPDECLELLGVADCPEPLPATFGPSLTGEQPAVVVGSEGPLSGTVVRLWGDADWTPELDQSSAARSRGVSLFTGGVRIEQLYEAGRGFAVSPDGRTSVASAVTGASDLPGPDTAGAPDGVDIVVVKEPRRILDEEVAGRGLLDVSTWVPTGDLAPGLLRAVTVGADAPGRPGGVLVGAPTDIAPTALVWYRRAIFEESGYTVPATFDELVALTDQMVADGRTPWCLGLAAGFAPVDGWQAATTVDALVMAEHGPDVHDAWVDGQVGFGDPRIASSVRRFAQLYLAPGRISGGISGALSTTDFRAIVRTLGPGSLGDCLMSVGPSTLGQGYPAAASFAFPPVTSAGVGTVVAGGTVVVPLTDRPEVRAVVRALTDHTVTTAATASGRWSFPADHGFDPGDIVDRRVRSLAATYGEALEADRVRFQSLVTMPEPVAAAFQAGMVEIVREGPDVIDEVLAGIDGAWPERP